MGIDDGDRAKDRGSGSGEALPAQLAKVLEERSEDQPTVVIDTAEGWRFSSGELDFSDEATKQRLSALLPDADLETI